MKYLITMQLQSILTFFFLLQAANVCTAPEPQNTVRTIRPDTPNKELAQKADNETVLADGTSIHSLTISLPLPLLKRYSPFLYKIQSRASLNHDLFLYVLYCTACWLCGYPCSGYYCCNSLCATDGRYCYCLY
ncbi:hypothetical protein M432DRAFT_605989 [Thermoascus aurantiacus ATCC 26904]